MSEPVSHFHRGEQKVQRRLGLGDSVAKKTKAFVRSFMPDQHRTFFSQLTFTALALEDQQGYPWALPLFGPEGFISSPDNKRLHIKLRSALFELLVAELNLNRHIGAKIGMLGIDLASRRRNRMNGSIVDSAQTSLDIAVEQSFGNCAKYIQARELLRTNTAASLKRGVLPQTAQYLNADAQALIRRADTFFIASRSAQFDSDWRSGMDVSHRGGLSGFVKCQAGELLFPDFSGNRFFNTLGNIEIDARVGLFFPDFSSGDAVFICGRAEVDWQPGACAVYPGAERLVRVHIDAVLALANGLEMRGKLQQNSPFLAQPVGQQGAWRDTN
ncbi:pyridoxamine 5'-phosphate oxidase family protein [Agaribacterium haliotis]|uniref:pyridoxamine 5'-phosphate oxidase family protein n=1 Tax=Agaribacterium haliotis TaxID=2013869 RepID=UPI000BB571C5|nr:pyridoxamine 5'-phosphate oxidase family protein [Agaribacterium haliotis]